MNKIILASHSKLASGMLETALFFGGESVEILEQTMTDTGFEQKVVDILEKNKKNNCIVFTDLMGGSVNQIFSKYLSTYNFHLITGMNLPIVLECMFSAQIIDDNFIREVIENAKKQLCYMNDILDNLSDDKDE